MNQPSTFAQQDASTDVVEVFIPYKNARALSGYYFGVFSLIPMIGLLLGPIAIVLGVSGRRFAKAHPEAKGGAHAMTAIILGSFASFLNWGVALLLLFMYVTKTNWKL